MKTWPIRDEIEWDPEFAAKYSCGGVSCGVYVGRCVDGLFWVDDAMAILGPYATRDEAVRSAADLASESH